MATQEEILALISAREKEKIHLELKSIEKIVVKEKKKREDVLRDIGYEIVALANTQGGKLIFGIKDDGSFNGEFKGDIDEVKRDIHDICYDRISPIVECEIEFLQCNGGDLFIVYIQKRKGIPHAYIDKRTGKDIKNRIYYTRTSHGKKLVNDAQLEWLFKNREEPNLKSSFRLGFELNKQMEICGDPIPNGNWSLRKFIRELSESDKEIIRRDSDKFSQLIIELLPYLYLDSLSSFFAHSWYIGISKGFDRTFYGEITTSTPTLSNQIDILKIKRPKLPTINSLSWNFENVLKKIFTQKFHIPFMSSIKIETKESGKLASLVIKHKNFIISIKSWPLSAGAGMHQRGTNFEVLNDRLPFDGHYYSSQNFTHFDGEGLIEGKFNFPEYDIEQFNKHLYYFNILKELFKNEWDFNHLRKQLPKKEILVIDSKLNEVLEILNYRGVNKI